MIFFMNSVDNSIEDIKLLSIYFIDFNYEEDMVSYKKIASVKYTVEYERTILGNIKKKIDVKYNYLCDCWES